jgi:ABC-2 type transport system permease protein
VGIGLGSQLLEKVFGQPLLSRLFGELFRHAGQAMISTPGGFQAGAGDNPTVVLRALPGWLVRDFGLALQDLASPLLLGGLLFAAGCFALLVIWRQRGAGGSA